MSDESESEADAPPEELWASAMEAVTDKPEVLARLKRAKRAADSAASSGGES